MSTEPRYDEPVVNHLGQATADLERAIRFYTGLLGFTVERRIEIPDPPAAELLGLDPPLGLEVAYLRRGPFVLELMQFRDGRNPAWRERVFNEPGLTHLSISVVDLAATAAAVEAHGGTVVRALRHALVVRDPDGQLVELLPMDYRRRTDAELAAQEATDR